MKVRLTICVLTLGAALAAQQKEPPPLGAVAKASQEEKKTAPGGGKKYTDEDLDSRPRPWYRSGHASSSSVPSLSGSGSGNKGKDEGYWRARADKIRGRLQETTNRLNMLKARLDTISSDGLDVSLANGRSSLVASERQRLSAQMMDLEAQARNQEQALKDLEDEGRRAGALPGWFR